MTPQLPINPQTQHKWFPQLYMKLSTKTDLLAFYVLLNTALLLLKQILYIQ